MVVVVVVLFRFSSTLRIFRPPFPPPSLLLTANPLSIPASVSECSARLARSRLASSTAGADAAWATAASVASAAATSARGDADAATAATAAATRAAATCMAYMTGPGARTRATRAGGASARTRRGAIAGGGRLAAGWGREWGGKTPLSARCARSIQASSMSTTR